MDKNSGMHFFPAHFVDHSVDRRMRIFVDQDSIVMMRIDPNLIRHRIAEEQRLVIKVEFNVHGNGGIGL